MVEADRAGEEAAVKSGPFVWIKVRCDASQEAGARVRMRVLCRRAGESAKRRRGKKGGRTHPAAHPAPSKTPQMPTRCQTLTSIVLPSFLNHGKKPFGRVSSSFGSCEGPSRLTGRPFSSRSVAAAGAGECSSPSLDRPSSVGTDSLARAGSSSSDDWGGVVVVDSD